MPELVQEDRRNEILLLRSNLVELMDAQEEIAMMLLQTQRRLLELQYFFEEPHTSHAHVQTH